MIIEHYSEKPEYIISALRIKNMYGEDLPPNKRHYIYLTSDAPPFLSSLISSAATFASTEKARLWWDLNRVELQKEVDAFCDPSTLSIRKRMTRIIEEDVENIGLET